MVRPQGKGTRVHVVLNDELKEKVDRIMIVNRLESYPQTLRLIIKYFDEQAFNERNQTLYMNNKEE